MSCNGLLKFRYNFVQLSTRQIAPNYKNKGKKETSREYVRRSGFKRYSFNPNYYPKARGRMPLTKYLPESYPHKWVNPKMPNNAHNVPIFWRVNSPATEMVRTWDPLHGERFSYRTQLRVSYSR